MPHPALSAAVARLGRAAALTADPDPAETDGRLLARFVRDRDEPAFRELVRRVGPMVLGVCRRVSGDAHLADDAFQAAFLVLARRADDVRPREAVRGWLYGVAVRTAREARSVSARRRRREALVPTLPERPIEVPDAPDADALRILDEEVAALPEHLRAAVALCELDGLGRKEAAARLGVPEGTLSSRLAKARRVLAGRLRKRGVALAAAALGVAFGQLASAAVPPRLADRAAALSTSSGAVPPTVAALSNGVFRSMLLHKLKMFAAGGLALAVAWVAVGSLPGVSAQDAPKPAAAPAPAAPQAAAGKKPQPAAKKTGPGILLLVRYGEPYQLLTPDGRAVSEFSAPKGTGSGGPAVVSPDGARVAFMVTEDGPPRAALRDGEEPKPWPFKVVVRPLGKPDAEKAWDMPARWLTLCWTADGKRVVVGKHSELDRGKNVENLLLDPETGKTEKLDLPAGVWVLDAARDGKTFLVALPAEKKVKVGLASAGDAAIRELTEFPNWPPGSITGRLSPDGTKVLLAAADPERKHAHKWGVSQRPYLLDVKTKKVEPLPDFPENAQARGVAWSPDGKRVAYTWHQLHEEILKKDTLQGDDTAVETEAFLIVADADGRNPKTVTSGKGPFAINLIFGAIDWR
jgi:RNA polymerase sigma factor (sigma-70 family)